MSRNAKQSLKLSRLPAKDENDHLHVANVIVDNRDDETAVTVT